MSFKCSKIVCFLIAFLLGLVGELHLPVTDISLRADAFMDQSQAGDVDCTTVDCSELVREIQFNADDSWTSSLSWPARMRYINGVSGATESGECTNGVLDPKCRDAETLIVNQSLTFCDSVLSFDCIEFFRIVLDTGQHLDGRLIGSVNENPDQAGAVSSLGPFISDNLVEFVLPNGQRESYFLKVPVAYQFGYTRQSLSSGMVRALDQIQSPFFYGGDFRINQVGLTSRTGVNQNPYRCVPFDPESCWTPISDGVLRRFQLALRRNVYRNAPQRQWGDWKSGALGSPKVAITQAQGNRPERILYDAMQVEIPSVNARFEWNNRRERNEWEQVDAALKSVDRWESRPWCGGPLELGLPACPKLRGTFQPSTKLVYPNTMLMPDPYSLYEKMVSIVPRLDTASSISEQLFIVSQPPWNVTWNGCSVGTGASFGFSSSNGLAIKNGIPEWDSKVGAIKVDVIAPHRASPQTVLRGSYSLVLPESTISCLWGKSARDLIRVEVSVYDTNGATKAAVTSAAVNDGLFTFSASGFNYSTAQIVIRGTSLSGSSTTKRLTCVKNGVKKLQLKGVTRCPRGWRKR